MKMKIGSRSSPLARIQSAEIANLLKEKFPELEMEFVFIKTSGDNRERPFSEPGGKGAFVREIEQALLDGSIHIAVHSMKDLPSILPDGLTIGSVPKREDPSDCILFPKGKDSGISFERLNKGAKIGTGSFRRKFQILDMRSDISVEPISGNIGTRIAKMDSGKVDALVLATAALKRLQIKNRTVQILNPEDFVPSPGQGALAVECREKDLKTIGLIKMIECGQSRLCVEVERSFLHKLGGDCSIPAGCYARKNRNIIQVSAFMISPDSEKIHRENIEANEKEGPKTGDKIAEKIMSAAQGKH